MDVQQAKQAISDINSHLLSRGWDGVEVAVDPSWGTEDDDPSTWTFLYQGPLTEETPRTDWDSNLDLDSAPEEFHEELADKAEEAMSEGWRPYDWAMLPESLWSPERQFGLTTSFDLAGYLTPSGDLLDLSEGSGSRMLDHRSIGGSRAMQEFIASGNIRVMPENGYLDIRSEPTEAQYRKIAQYAGQGLKVNLSRGLGPFDERMGFYMEDPGTESRQYEETHTPAQIVADIRNFYSRPVEAWVRRNCKLAATGHMLQKVWVDPWGRTYWKADVKNDSFVHFADRETARQIVRDKLLRHDLGYVQDAFAISTRYGMHLPTVQSTHIEKWYGKRPEDIVAVLFTTDLPPALGRPEEVFWKQDVPLKDAALISKEEAESLLPAQSPLDEGDSVFYDWSGEAGQYVRQRMAREEERDRPTRSDPVEAWVRRNCKLAASDWTYDDFMRWYKPLEQIALDDPGIMREVEKTGRLSESTIRRTFGTDEGQTNFFYRMFNDLPEVARRRQEVNREEREREEQAKRDEYYYHVLPAPALPQVLEQGLRPGQPALMENYQNYSRGKVFLTEAGGVPFWEWRVQDHYGHQTEEYDAPVAVVRVRKSDVPDVSPDETGTQDARIESYYVTSPIPPDKLEVVKG